MEKREFTATAKKVAANWAVAGVWTDGIGVYTDCPHELTIGKTYKVTIEEVKPA